MHDRESSCCLVHKTYRFGASVNKKAARLSPNYACASINKTSIPLRSGLLLLFPENHSQQQQPRRNTYTHRMIKTQEANAMYHPTGSEPLRQATHDTAPTMKTGKTNEILTPNTKTRDASTLPPCAPHLWRLAAHLTPSPRPPPS